MTELFKALVDLSPFISALTALVAVILSPFISWCIAKKQIELAEKNIKASVVSGNRQNWINELRDCISEYQATAHNLLFPISDESLLCEYFNKLDVLRYKIHLMINPNEDDHQELCKLIDSLIPFDSLSVDASKRKEKLTEFFSSQKGITPLAQKILKREWERVKNVE